MTRAGASRPTPPDVVVRRAVADDAASIGAVFDAAVRENWTFLGELADRPMFTAPYWDDLVADHVPPDALLVATDATNRVLGFTAVHVEGGEMFLLFVDPAQTGRGLGRLLLDAAHDVLRAGGVREAFLYAEERNARARSVYAAAGYRPDGTIRESDFHGMPLREVRLVKPL
jgi:ribosomal protein S18 acetylase RimI-like enzyme